MNEALDRFVEKKISADEKIKTILDYVANHCDTNPDDVNWSHVGDMDRLNNNLDEIMDFLGI